MTRGMLFRVCLLIFISVLCLNVNQTEAEEDCGCGNPPTAPGEIIRSTGVVPAIISSSETIANGGSITLYIDSDKLACPPYTWAITVGGDAYSFSSTVGNIHTATTTNDLETVTLTCISSLYTSCASDGAYVTITVTDACGVTDDIIIRNTSGKWSKSVKTTTLCNDVKGSGLYSALGRTIGGKYRYSITWSCCGGVSKFNSCTASILANLEGYGLDSFTAVSDSQNINIFTGGTTLRAYTCGGHDYGVQMQSGSSSWTCLGGLGIRRHEWSCSQD